MCLIVYCCLGFLPAAEHARLWEGGGGGAERSNDRNLGLRQTVLRTNRRDERLKNTLNTTVAFSMECIADTPTSYASLVKNHH